MLGKAYVTKLLMGTEAISQYICIAGETKGLELGTQKQIS